MVLTDQAKKATLLHTHTCTHEQTWGLRRCSKIAPSSWNCAPFSFTEHPPQGWKWLVLWDEWKGDPRNSFPFPPSGCLTEDPRPNGCTSHGLWAGGCRPCPSSPRATSALAQRAVDSSNVLSTHVHSTHIPWFANGRGQTPCSPLETSLETWK